MLFARPMSGQVSFGPFLLDLEAGRLLRDDREVPLRPKTWAVLCYLAANPARLVTKRELLDAVWADVQVTEDMAAKCVRELRQALGESGRSATYLEVVHGRGYRLRPPPPSGSPRRPDRVDRPAEVEESRLPPIVGRAEELERVASAIARARHGEAGMMVVVGEAGIGKSRLLAEAVRRGAAQGFAAHVGRCFEGETGPPFWPWVQIIRSCLRQPDSEEVRRALEARGNDLAQLLPELRSSSGTPSRGDGFDSDQARFRLFDSVVTLLGQAAEKRPLLLVLEDLHWVDSASLMLLQVVLHEARGRSQLVLGSHRDDEGDGGETFRRVLATLRREGLCERIVLTGFDGAATGSYLGSLAGSPVAPALAAGIQARTNGNPYFSAELWTHLVAEGALRLQDGQWCGSTETRGIPEGIAATIGRRLERLPSDCRALLAGAAACGIEFEMELAVWAAGLDAARGLDAIDEALRARLITDATEWPGRYRFTHALAAEAMYAELSAARRAHLHGRIAERLEQVRFGERPADAALLAHHYLLATGQGVVAKAVAYSRAAAAEATAACGYEAAAAHLEQALALLPAAGASASDPKLAFERCGLILDTAESHARAGDGAAARLRFEEGARLALSLGDTHGLARAALGMATRWTFADATVIALLEDALAQASHGDAALRARLLARLAQSLYLIADTRARREALCDEALAMARTTGDPRLIAMVLNDALEALFHSDNLSEQEARATSLHAAAELCGDQRSRLQAHAWRIVIAMGRGHLRDAAAEIETFRALAEQIRQPEYLSQAHAFVASIQIARGELDVAEEQARAAARLATRLHRWSGEMVAFVQLFTIRREQQRAFALESDDHSIRFATETGPAGEVFQRSARWQLPFALCEQGKLDDARALVATMMANLDDLPAENARNSRVPALASISDAVGRLGDRDAATKLLPLVQPYADQWTVVGFGAVVGASVQNVLGTLTGTLGRYAEATAHFERAIAEHDRESAVMAQARTLANYARVLIQRGEPGRAREQIERGLALTSTHGLASSEHKLRQLLAGLQQGGGAGDRN